MHARDQQRGRVGRRELAVWSRVTLTPGARPLDLLTARFDRHQYAPHAHEEFAVGVTSGGLETIAYRGGHLVSGPGSIVVLEPGEIHTGGPALSDAGYAYRALYPPPALLAEACHGDGDRPHFRSAVIHDPQLADALARAHRAASRPPGHRDPLHAESELPWLLATLARRHAVPGSARPSRPLPRGDGERVARVVRQRLADQPLAPPSLAEIAADLGLSRYQVLRAFRSHVGMPPYAWLAQHRVARARALLDAGQPPAAVATAVGFADQAHLTRWFRRVLGVTPGVYRDASRNSVQDTPR
ncbi:AraC family transcriptional regulator [Streptomyces sp. 4N509B]|uniref:AraC family transcriptional regulator n=1 Tax=Streptomyces sp. 4N509B TaxID=3457413 RepID=UPI003FD58A7D